MLDANINASAQGLDETSDIPATPQEEAKVHNSMDHHPHSTLKPDQLCPLGMGERGGKRNRDDGGEEGEDDDMEAKREKLEDDSREAESH